MRFIDIPEHKDITDIICNIIDKDRLPHALLFTEQKGYGALTIALASISYMFCTNRNNGTSCGECAGCIKIAKLTHPDLHFVFPTNTSVFLSKDKKSEIDEYYPFWRELVISNPYFSEQQLYKALGIDNKLGNIGVNEANSIIKKLSLSSFEGGAKVMIIMFPERMNIEAANRLLKNLEEPMPGTYYFLISQSPDKIISTILSRCRRIEVQPLEDKVLAKKLMREVGVNEDDANFWARCSGGSFGLARELITTENEKTEAYKTFISLLEKCVAKDFVGIFDIWEGVAAWGKESQKEFCMEGLAILRKLFILNLGIPSISFASQSERVELDKITGKLKNTFYEKGYSALNQAIEHIERNVNAKFIFSDLCNKLFINA